MIRNPRNGVGSMLLLGLASLLVSAVSALGQVKAPCGNFALFGGGQGNPQMILNTLQNPNVDGASIRLEWADFEKQENSFDYITYLNGAVQQCLDANKPASFGSALVAM